MQNGFVRFNGLKAVEQSPFINQNKCSWNAPNKEAAPQSLCKEIPRKQRCYIL